MNKDIKTTIRKLQEVYKNTDCYEKNLLTKQNVTDYFDYINQNTKNDCGCIFPVTDKQMNELVMAWEDIEQVTDDIKQYCEINSNGKYAVKEARFYSFEKDDCMCCFDNRDSCMYGEEFGNEHYALGIMYLEGEDINKLQQMINMSNEEKNTDEIEYEIEI